MRKIHLVQYLICLLAPGSVIAQNINYNQPPNSSFLAEYGISPRIFNVIISPMYQEDAVFQATRSVEETIGTDVTGVSYEVMYNPFYEYGLSLEVIVKDDQIYDRISRPKLKREVGKTNEKYKKIRDRDVITESEVGLLSENGTNTVFGFRLRKESLPNDLKYLSKMNGSVIITNGVLEKIELNLSSPAKMRGIQATDVRYFYEFTRSDEGGYLFRSSSEYIRGTKNGEPVEINNTLKIIRYQDRKGNTMLEFDTPPYEATSAEPDTLKVKLERSLPFLGNAARRAGYELPLPYGVDLFTHFQREDLGFEKVILNGEDLTDGILAPGGSSARAITNLIAARGDVWILPFVNVTLMSGYIYGSTDINLALSDEVKDALDLIGIEADQISASVDVTGPMMGGGLTVAGGYKNFFATVNGMYIKQFVKEAGTDVDAIAITPLAGVRFPKLVNVIVGGQYQIYNSNVSGTISLEGEPLNFDVELKTTRWNWLFGLQRDFSNHWNGSVMVGFDPRPQTTIVLGYRF